MKVEWIGPVFDGSGYGSASRNYALALHSVGIEVMVRPISFEATKPDLGETGAFLQSLIRDPMPKADVRVIHCTPDIMPSTIKDLPWIPTVGYATWEANKLPPGWADAINNSCTGLMVPSVHNVRAFIESGVTCRVDRVPHCFTDSPVQGKRVMPEDDYFRFLNVGQWLTRKNQLGLLMAYLTEFKKEEKVSLVLKTFTEGHGPGERDQIKSFVRATKDGLHLKEYPQVELIVSNLSKSEMQRLYHDCDCIVSLHRCEGFGITLAEGMLAGLPAIATQDAGTDDYMSNCSSCWFIRSQRTPVFGMPWKTYSGDMTWMEPDLWAAKRAMRDIYSRKGINIGADGRKRILSDLSFSKVGDRMKEILEAQVGK